MSILGRVTIKIDGKRMKSKRGASLTLGGPKRSPVVGSTEVHGFTTETTAPMLTAKFTQQPDAGLTFFQSVSGATIVFEGDDGKNYVIDGGTCIDEPQLTEQEGEISVKFSGTSCTES